MQAHDSPTVPTVAAPSMLHRHGDWMHTFTGRRFWPLDPRPEDVTIEDIAHALSLVCRYQGHTNRFYSVAEHCVLMARAAEAQAMHPAQQIQALMHDAAETYVCDIVRPLKRSLGSPYSSIERLVDRAIQERFGLTAAGNSADTQELDNAILYDEARALLRVDLEPWHEVFAPGLGVEIVGWPPAFAERQFLEAFHRLWRPAP